MKKIILVLIALVALPVAALAQKYACVNTEYILSNIPDYSKAQSQLDKQSEAWQKELEAKFQEIDKLYKTYQQEAYLLPENLKHKREEEIIAREREAKELQNKYFGPGGDLDKKREELMKPIQDRVYSAIERIANEKRYDFILDKSGSVTLLYVNAKYDVSDQVLDLLGYKPNANAATPDNKDNAKDKGAQQKGKSVSNPEMRRPDNSSRDEKRNNRIDNKK